MKKLIFFSCFLLLVKLGVSQLSFNMYHYSPMLLTTHLTENSLLVNKITNGFQLPAQKKTEQERYMLLRSANYQSDSLQYQYNELNKKYNDAKKFRAFGIVLSVVGFGQLLGGVILDVKGTSKEISHDIWTGDNEADKYYHNAKVLFVTGSVCTVLGLPIWISQNNKAKHYRKEMNHIDKVQLRLSATTNGATVSLKF